MGFSWCIIKKVEMSGCFVSDMSSPDRETWTLYHNPNTKEVA